MNILALDPATRCGFAWSDGRTVYSGAWQLPKDSPGARLITKSRLPFFVLQILQFSRKIPAAVEITVVPIRCLIENPTWGWE